MYYELPPSAPVETRVKPEIETLAPTSRQPSAPNVNISREFVQPSIEHIVLFSNQPSDDNQPLHDTKSRLPAKTTAPDSGPAQVLFSSGASVEDTSTTVLMLSPAIAPQTSDIADTVSPVQIAQTQLAPTEGRSVQRDQAESVNPASDADDAPSVDEVAQTNEPLVERPDRDDALRIRPRFGAGYTSSGGSFGNVGRFESFVPLWQEVGDEIGFLEVRLVFGEDTDFGGSLLLGYRNYNEDQNRIRGGYVGIDGRDTGESTFYQLGAGYERLGEEWDFRINGYFPIGDRDNVITDITNSTGTPVSTGFVGNQFVLNSQLEQQQLQQTEVALGGFDAEAGYRLTEWDDGDLTAAGGVYIAILFDS